MKFGTRLTFILILTGFLPLLLGGLFLFYFFEDHFKETTHKNLEEVRDFAFFQTETFLENSLESVNSLSQNSVLTSGDAFLIEIEEELSTAYEKHKHLFRRIDILDVNGDIITSTKEEDHEKWGDNRWFIEVKEREKTVISDIYATETREPELAIFSPNFDEEGEIVSFIVALIDMVALFQEIDFKVWEDGETVIINSDGKIIFHSNEEYLFTEIGESYPLKESFSIKKGKTDFYFKGEEVVACFRVIEKENIGLKWQLVTFQSKGEIFYFLKNITTNYGLLLIILLFLIIIVSFFITKRIMKPLKILSLVAKRVGRGDLSAQAEVFSRDEFGELAENFNKMTRELQEAKEKMEEEKNILEIKVKARTRELNQLNKELEDKVQERMIEIEKKLKEHEKMSKLMVGREMRMVEIKKQIKEAEEEIKRLKKENTINEKLENES